MSSTGNCYVGMGIIDPFLQVSSARNVSKVARRHKINQSIIFVVASVARTTKSVTVTQLVNSYNISG